MTMFADVGAVGALNKKYQLVEGNSNMLKHLELDTLNQLRLNLNAIAFKSHATISRAFI